MPIKIPNQLPATQTLRQENIFVMTETRAITQDIRPLRILLLNLMPTKVDTETQFARVLGQHAHCRLNLSLSRREAIYRKIPRRSTCWRFTRRLTRSRSRTSTA